MNSNKKMFIYLFGSLSILCGFLILLLPLIITELSRPSDWLMGGLFLVLGLILLVENDLLSGSLILLVISGTTLLGKMILEVSQSRWYQLSTTEKAKVGSFNKWVQSLKQLGQVFGQLGNGLFEFLRILKKQQRKSLSEKKWVHPDLKKEMESQKVFSSDEDQSHKINNEVSTKNEESS